MRPAEVRSFRVDCNVAGEWVHNNVFLKTRPEAQLYADDVFERWSAVVDTRIESDAHEPTHVWDGELVLLTDRHAYIPGLHEGRPQDVRPNCYKGPDRCKKDQCNQQREHPIHKI